VKENKIKKRGEWKRGESERDTLKGTNLPSCKTKSKFSFGREYQFSGMSGLNFACFAKFSKNFFLLAVSFQ
jgi:hypothetical protein